MNKDDFEYRFITNISAISVFNLLDMLLKCLLEMLNSPK